MLAVRAVRQKLRAVASLGTFWPAVARGGRLLARGRVREFAGKLFNEAATVRAVDDAPVRSGPPLVLAGHALRPGGYDHVVLAVLDGHDKLSPNIHFVHAIRRVSSNVSFQHGTDLRQRERHSDPEISL